MQRTIPARCAALALACAVVLAGAAASAASAPRPIVVASKNFTESYILGTALAQLLTNAGFPVEHKLGLGGTKICFDALVAGEVDAYVDYTGSISGSIKTIDDPTLARLTVALAQDGVEMLPPLGFNNTYAIAVAAPVAAAHGLTRISDLAAQPALRLAFSHEFMERRDGWLGLKPRYGLPHTPAGIEHALAYQAIVDGAIDVTDAYSTDGELERYPLTVLEDDKGFFPVYLAVPLVRADLPPRARAVIATMSGTLTAAQMRTLNAAAIAGESIESVAAGYLAQAATQAATPSTAAPAHAETLGRLAANTGRHLQLVAWAVAPATLLAVLVAVAIFQIAWLSRAAVYIAGLLQTIPSIALLALLIPLTGIGVVPAVVALFLYALLPVLRNAITALTGIDPTLRRVAVAMGLTPAQQLRHVFIPLAMPSILAGVRTAAVISIGTATLAAFIGAGGLGDPIVTGLALNDTRLILEGAIPAALLAVVAELLFELVERVSTPGHLLRGGQ